MWTSGALYLPDNTLRSLCGSGRDRLRFRRHKSGMITDGLVGINHGKRRDRVIEGFALPHVPCNGSGVAGPSVRAGQGPTAQLSVTDKGLLFAYFANAAQSAIFQSSNIELPPRGFVLGVAEKD